MTTRRGPGRPLALTDELADRITNLIENAATTYRHAAISLGVPASTAMRWQELGRAAQERRDMGAKERRDTGAPTTAVDRPYRDLMDAVDEARSTAVNRLLTKMLAATEDPKNWQAITKALGWLDPDTYRETHRSEVTGAGGGPVKQEIETTLSGTELASLAASLLPVGLVAPVEVSTDVDTDEYAYDSGDVTERNPDQ